uniref:T-box domain-containing protein n=1 Tax=Panagrolaimus sp. PS1159 TaxID=55785 RepID=A0AC35G0N8_9BILA
MPPPKKIQKLEIPQSSPSCSDSDSESALIKQENDEAAAAPNTPIGNWPTLGTSEKLSTVQCRLEGKELWAKFYDLSTEMIITKSGRLVLDFL